MARDVALFITCLTDQFHPRVGVAVVKILEHFGCRVHFPQGQTCCGQPFFNNGFHPEARDLARRMVEVFEPYEHVVTPSGSCCAMVREHFPRLLKDDHAWESACHKVCSSTFEFVEFLEKVLKADVSKFRLPDTRTVTYHYNCHLRGIGMTDAAVRLLKRMGNVDFRPLEKADQCCGFGGTFAVKYPQISGAMAMDKIDCIAKSGAQTVICNDAGCAMNIAGMSHRQGMTTRVEHIAEVLADAMGLTLEGW
jgi:L-lactate dehydrogenase complex protein LldE